MLSTCLLLKRPLSHPIPLVFLLAQTTCLITIVPLLSDPTPRSYPSLSPSVPIQLNQIPQHPPLQLQQLFLANHLLVPCCCSGTTVTVYLLALMQNQVRLYTEERDAEDFERRGLGVHHCFGGAVDFCVVEREFGGVECGGLGGVSQDEAD